MTGRAVRGWLILGPLALSAALMSGLVGAHAREGRSAADATVAGAVAERWRALAPDAAENGSISVGAAILPAGDSYDVAMYRRSDAGFALSTALPRPRARLHNPLSGLQSGVAPDSGTSHKDIVGKDHGETGHLWNVEPGPAFPRRLPAGVVARLDRLDRPFEARMDGRMVAVAPLHDATEWETLGAVVVARRGPFPARFAGWPLLGGVVALVLAWLALRITEARPAWMRAAAVLAPGAGLAASVVLLAPRAAPAVGVVGAAWLVVAGVGVSLLPLDRQRLALREAATGWAFLAPSLAHLLVFSLGPIAFALWLSFHRWNLVEPQRPFVGLANYVELAGDGAFLHSLANTAVYVLFVPVGMAVALGLALLVNRPFRGVRVVRAILFLPYITSFVAISLVWKWIYEPDFGLFNLVLERLGLGGLPWLTSPATAMLSLQIMSVWMYAGYMMVLFLAGLQSIPASLYESARMDGAGPWQRFRHITLPLLRPTTFFVLVTMVIFMFQVFTAVYVMTEGGPLHATDVIVYHIYRNAWEYLRMGYASAMAWVLFAVVFALTMAQWRWIGRERA